MTFERKRLHPLTLQTKKRRGYALNMTMPAGHIRARVLCRSVATNGASQRSGSACQFPSMVGPSKRPTTHESPKTPLANPQKAQRPKFY